MKNGFRLLALALLSLSCLAVTNCEPKTEQETPPPGFEALLSAQTGIELDAKLSDEERSTLLKDLYRAQTLKIAPPKNSYFTQIFGAPSSAGVMHYLSERVHYVLPKAIKLDSRLVRSDSQLNVKLSPARAGVFQIYTFAINVGTMLWFEALANPSQALSLQFGEKLIPISSSRVGIIQLGEGYTLKDASPTLTSQLIRITTIIHEARHSDCTGGISSLDLERIQMGDEPLKSTCGHLHVRCPEGHKYDGAYACDGEAWGAYSVQATYLGALVKSCKNCTEEEKSLATTLFAESLERVIPLKDMLAGKMGDPDMSSSTEVHPTDGDTSAPSPYSLRIQ